MQPQLSPSLLAALVSALKFMLDQDVQVGIDPSITSHIVFCPSLELLDGYGLVTQQNANENLLNT